MILDLTSSLPILIWSSIMLAVQLDIHRFCCLGSGQDRINFCSSGEGAQPGHGSLFPTTSHHCQGQVEKEVSSREKGLLPVKSAWWWFSAGGNGWITSVPSWREQLGH